jgi:hypothetical protein
MHFALLRLPLRCMRPDLSAPFLMLLSVGRLLARVPEEESAAS